jgi:ABC-type multidrug transport system ATPase subunit
MGRAPSATGHIRVQSKATTLAGLAQAGLLGFVPQEDTLLLELTCREILTHAARARITPWSTEATAAVDRILQLLDLTHVQHTVVGRGLSGGERKRVSIAVEMLANPAMLILDEPSSGLDAAAAQHLMDCLHKIASQAGVTVVAVLHQPRVEIFAAFDDMLLLGPGGVTVYHGPASEAVHYVSTHVEGPLPVTRSSASLYPKSTSTDIEMAQVESADDLSKVAVQNVLTEPRNAQTDGEEQSEKEEEEDDNPADYLMDVLAVSKITPMPAPLLPPPSPSSASKSCSFFSTSSSSSRAQQSASTMRRPYLVQLIWLYMARAMKQDIRAWKELAIDIAQQTLPGIALGVPSLTRSRYLPPLSDELIPLCPPIIRSRCAETAASPTESYFNSFFICMVVSATSGISASRAFAYEKENARREFLSGASVLAYFLGKVFYYDLVHVVRIATTFVAFFLLVAAPGGPAWMWYSLVLCFVYAAFGMGYIVSAGLARERALIVACIVGVAVSVTSGSSPDLSVVQKWGPLQALWWISPARWAAEAMILSDTLPFRDDFRVADAIRQSGYDPNGFAMDIGMLVLIGTVFRCIACGIMAWQKRQFIRGK